ncbi:S1 family peptidase [Flavobacterium notoginsengisoli]|uniref:S1 family peptidase n=1 Tax=Flavobacterium notoginsengisoli TaxID=1478199 RepID=UPI00363971B3
MAKNIEAIKKANKLKNKIFYPRLYSAFQSTICFFCNDEKSNIVPAGSGVFINYKNNHYVVTAAHVLAEHSSDTFVILHDKELIIGGKLISSPMPASGDRKDDKIDISILKIDSQSVDDLLTRFTPIDVSEIETNHILKNTATYFCVGFPLTRTKKIWGKDEIKSLGFTYQSEAIINFDFEKFGFNKTSTYAIKYDGEVTSAKIPQVHLSPKIIGISGSGLWHFYGENKKSLIGIVLERINEPSNKAILATKIEIVLKMIEAME